MKVLDVKDVECVSGGYSVYEYVYIPSILPTVSVGIGLGIGFGVGLSIAKKIIDSYKKPEPIVTPDK